MEPTKRKISLIPWNCPCILRRFHQLPVPSIAIALMRFDLQAGTDEKRTCYGRNHTDTSHALHIPPRSSENKIHTTSPRNRRSYLPMSPMVQKQPAHPCSPDFDIVHYKMVNYLYKSKKRIWNDRKTCSRINCSSK